MKKPSGMPEWLENALAFVRHREHDRKRSYPWKRITIAFAYGDGKTQETTCKAPLFFQYTMQRPVCQDTIYFFDKA